MPKLFKKKSKKAGLSPGTLSYIGDRPAEEVKITVIDYDEARYEEKTIASVEEAFPFRDSPTVTWVNIDGIHRTDIIEKIGTHFQIHPLILEDIVNSGQRPKLEDFGDFIYIVLKMLRYDEKEEDVVVEQVSVLLGSGFVISFQEVEGDVFEPIRTRIKNAKGRHRRMGSDYLAYSLIDAIVDNYFFILEKLGEIIEEEEDELVSHPTPETLQTIHRLKRQLIIIRKSVWPLREVISAFQRLESKLIQSSISIYLKDVYDHTIQVIDTIESFRDMVAGMLDTYLSSVSNRMNEIMKVLTLIATIFIPLTFIVGIYGMNFEHMPELRWHWFYPNAFWLIILMIAGVMFYFFKKKRWL